MDKTLAINLNKFSKREVDKKCNIRIKKIINSSDVIFIQNTTTSLFEIFCRVHLNRFYLSKIYKKSI